ncbi:MAG: CsgG/HfaB family protein [Bacteroidota bacterium]
MKYYAKMLTILAMFFLVGNSATGEEIKNPTIAVFDFELANTVTQKITKTTAQGGRSTKEITHETSLLRDKFVTALSKNENVTVVERSKIKKIMDEAKLSQSDLTDPEHSMELGKLLGADYFLLGSISMLEGSVDSEKLPYNAGMQTVMEYAAGANIRIVETETGEIVTAESARTKSEKKILDEKRNTLPEELKQETYEKLVDEMADTVMSEIFPTLVAAYDDGIVYLNKGKMEEGARKRIIQKGEAIEDPSTGKVLGTTETEIAVVEIIEGLDNLSKAKVIDWTGEKKDIPDGATCRPIKKDKPD